MNELLSVRGLTTNFDRFSPSAFGGSSGRVVADCCPGGCLVSISDGANVDFCFSPFVGRGEAFFFFLSFQKRGGGSAAPKAENFVSLLSLRSPFAIFG